MPAGTHPSIKSTAAQQDPLIPAITGPLAKPRDALPDFTVCRLTFVFRHGASGRGGGHYPQFMNKIAES